MIIPDNEAMITHPEPKSHLQNTCLHKNLLIKTPYQKVNKYNQQTQKLIMITINKMILINN